MTIKPSSLIMLKQKVGHQQMKRGRGGGEQGAALGHFAHTGIQNAWGDASHSDAC